MNSFSIILRRGLTALALPAVLMAVDAARAEAQGRPPFRPTAALSSLDRHSLIPVPESVTRGQGAPFVINASTSIVVPAASAHAARIGEELAMLLRAPTGFRIPVVTQGGASTSGAITLALGGADSLGAEGYEMTIAAGGVRITAYREPGLYRGIQTLRQLLPAGIEAEQSAVRMATAWSVPPGRILDRPRFEWRGIMLDVSRHFFTVHEVKQVIDILALYRMNRLHLHLADDQGWRIQIDSWPKLTEVGGSTQVGGGPGGFYTKEDYAEIVRYADEKFIVVVPEIDMPGHTNAAIASYPELGCSRPTPGFQGDTQPPGVYTGIRVGWSAFCHDREIVYQFVDDVMRELAEMTTGPWLHVGGDEVEVLNERQYASFINRVQDIVNKHGKAMVGWEEIGQATLRPSSIAQYWRSSAAMRAARQGVKMIMSPAPKMYLDMRYTRDTELGLAWAGYVDLRTSYDWDPATYQEGLGEDAIIGVEAPLWTETIRNITAAQYMLMPRLPAIAEMGWSRQERRSWQDFRTRLAAHAPRWRLMGVNYYPSPQVNWDGPAM